METQNNKPLVGQKLEPFSLDAFFNNQLIKINSDSLKGKWLVLFFYPADFTFVCPTELGDMADNYEAFQNENAEILSISTDTNFVHKAWFDGSETIKRIKFPMLADPTGNFCRSLGTYIETEGLSYRATIIVDPAGIIQSYEINSNNIGRNAAETLRKIQAAKFVYEHGGEVCPARWKPGDKTLKPGIELVGKI